MFSPKVNRAQCRAQKFRRGGVALVHLDLLDGGVALDVDDALAAQEVVVEFVRAADVEQRVGVARRDRSRKPRDSPAVSSRRLVARAERPAALETELRRQPREDARRIGIILGRRLLDRIVRNARRVLDVIHLVPEALQADDVMDVLPDHARQSGSWP